MESKTYNISFNTNYLEHIGNKNSGRYPRGSGENPYQHVKKGEIYWRYSGKKETGPTKYQYIFNPNNKEDLKGYTKEAYNGWITNHAKKLYKIKIEAIDNVTVANGKEIYTDLLERTKKYTLNFAKEFKKDNDRYKFLKERAKRIDDYKKYIKDMKSNNDGTITLPKNNMSNENNKIADSIYDYKANNNTDFMRYLDKYAKKGNDAIVDVEDMLRGYETSKIILNSDKFKRVKISRKINMKKLKEKVGKISTAAIPLMPLAIGLGVTYYNNNYE